MFYLALQAKSQKNVLMCEKNPFAAFLFWLVVIFCFVLRFKLLDNIADTN